MIEVLIHRFIIRLPVLINWKRVTYDSILVIVERLIKIVYYEPCFGGVHPQDSSVAPSDFRLDCQ